MREVRVVLWDDVAITTGQKVPADGTHLLQLDGQAVELDLSDGSLGALQKDLANWFAIGRKPDAPAHRRRAPRKPAAWYRGLHAFAELHGVARPRKGSKYPAGMIREYEASLSEGTGKLATEGSTS